MFIDVAKPNGNEEDFISQAKKLDTKGIIFLYENPKKIDLEKIKSLNTKNFHVKSGIIVKDKVAGKKCDFIFSKGLRSHFENGNVEIIFGLEEQHKKDKHHYRKSGLNQVLCGLAKSKKIMIGYGFSSVLKAKDRGLIVGRMIQNINMCRKYKVQVMIASFAEKPQELRFWKDLVSFGITLGLNHKDAKEAVLNRKV